MSLYNSFMRTLRKHPYAWIRLTPPGCSPEDVARVEECRKHGSQRTEQEKQEVAFDLRLFRNDIKQLFAEEVNCPRCAIRRTLGHIRAEVPPCRKHQKQRELLVKDLFPTSMSR